MIQTQYQPRIVRRTELWVPHNDREIAFAPLTGPDNYINVGKKILSEGKDVPIGDYTSSLLHAVYCSDLSNEPEFMDIKNKMKFWLWVFNRNLWTPEGVYVVPDTNAIGLSETLEISDLEKTLQGVEERDGIRFSKDKKVRFARKGTYSTGSKTPKDFAKDSFIIASCDYEGAEKLGEVAEKFRMNPFVYILDIQKRTQQRVSAVDGNVDRLWFDGYDWDVDSRGHASGVWK